MTENELIELLEKMRIIMVGVSTGGHKIQEVDSEYTEYYKKTESALQELGIENPIPYPDLWDWYGRWVSGDLPSHQSRRTFLSDIFNPLVNNIKRIASGEITIPEEPSGWPRVDRLIAEVRLLLATAKDEEQFQAVGMLCREALISLAHAVYDPEKHPTEDNVIPSKTDSKRMLTAFIPAVLVGGINAEARRHAKAAVEMALALQHRKTADFRDAAMCLEATTAAVNIFAIVSGRRDP